MRRRRRTLGLAPEAAARVHDAERSIVDRKAESFLVFDPDGKQVYRRDGRGKYKVTIREEEFPVFRDRVVTHNHPALRCAQYEAGELKTYLTAGTLSPADVRFAARRDAAEMRVVARDFVDGKVRTIVYSLERPAGGWPQGWQLDDFIKSTDAVAKVVMARLHAEVRSGRAQLCHVNEKALDEAWKYKAPQIGAKYTATVLEGAAPRSRQGRRR